MQGVPEPMGTSEEEKAACAGENIAKSYAKISIKPQNKPRKRRLGERSKTKFECPSRNL